MQNIAIIFGGRTVEHDISILTAFGIFKNLSSQYNIIPIYITRENEWLTSESFLLPETFVNNKIKGKKCYFKPGQSFLVVKGLVTKEIRIDCAIPAVHGGILEGGGLQGILEMSRVAYSSANICSSAICMDKIQTKKVVQAEKINTPKFVQISKSMTNEKMLNICKKLNYPLVVKPARLGSSIAVTFCTCSTELLNAIQLAFKYDNRVIVEEQIKDCIEINVAAYWDNEVIVSDLEKVYNEGKIFSFNSKYIEKKNKTREFPAQIDTDIKNKILDIVKKLYSSLDCFGIVRFDFLLSPDNKIFLNEINTIPGSFAFYLFKPKGINYAQLLHKNIQNAIKKRLEEEKFIFDFRSKVLSNLTQIKKDIIK